MQACPWDRFSELEFAIHQARVVKRLIFPIIWGSPCEIIAGIDLKFRPQVFAYSILDDGIPKESSSRIVLPQLVGNTPPIPD